MRDGDLWRDSRDRSSRGSNPRDTIPGGEIRVDDVLRLHAQALQIGAEQRRIGIHIQNARNADAQLLAPFIERNAASLKESSTSMESHRRRSPVAGERHTSRAAISTRFGLAALVASSLRIERRAWRQHLPPRLFRSWPG